MEKGRILTGARARFLLDGKKVGYARNVAMTEEIEWQPVETLDNIEVEEHVPIAYRVSMSASMFRIVGSTIKSEGFFPATGKSAEEHLVNILQAGVLGAQLEDSKTSKILAVVEQVRVASHNWTVDARGIVGEDVTFVGIRIKDESEVAA